MSVSLSFCQGYSRTEMPLVKVFAVSSSSECEKARRSIRDKLTGSKRGSYEHRLSRLRPGGTCAWRHRYRVGGFRERMAAGARTSAASRDARLSRRRDRIARGAFASLVANRAVRCSDIGSSVRDRRRAPSDTEGRGPSACHRSVGRRRRTVGAGRRRIARFRHDGGDRKHRDSIARAGSCSDCAASSLAWSISNTKTKLRRWSRNICRWDNISGRARQVRRTSRPDWEFSPASARGWRRKC